jgi:hypothetical protein
MNVYETAAKLMAIVQKAGARHSAKDNALVQQMHDRACELGAKCHCETPTHPMLASPTGGTQAKAMVYRHPGHPNQKVHGNRFGGFEATKESLRRLKGDKEARTKYKESARKRSAKAGAAQAERDTKEFRLDRIGKTKIPKPEELARGKPDMDTIDRFRRSSDKGLTSEYQDLAKASFDRMFGHNAKANANLAAAVLHERGIKRRKNIFGDLPVEFL